MIIRESFNADDIKDESGMNAAEAAEYDRLMGDK